MISGKQKGRQFVPTNERDGIWFKHKGMENSAAALERLEATSTGRMLHTPFSPQAACRPPPPPCVFQRRARKIYTQSNPFSQHDNRHAHQGSGEYFGEDRESRSLGLRMLPVDTLGTKPDFLKHYSRNPVDYDYSTEFASAYTPKTRQDGPNRPRFKRSWPEPGTGPVELPTTTTKWFRDTHEKAMANQVTTQNLGMSYLPYVKPNPWKYSYKGSYKAYPPGVGSIRMPKDSYGFNGYGNAFTTLEPSVS